MMPSKIFTLSPTSARMNIKPLETFLPQWLLFSFLRQKSFGGRNHFFRSVEMMVTYFRLPLLTDNFADIEIEQLEKLRLRKEPV